MTNRFAALALIGVLGATAACTSSNSVTNQQSSAGYDQQYRTNTQGTQGTYGPKPEEQQATDAPVTIMQVSMETGDVYPGEDYFVYAVVDNPTEREGLEYVWSTTSGAQLAEVPEAERGRLTTVVETAYGEASAAAAPATVAPAPAADAAVSQPVPDNGSPAPEPSTARVQPGGTSTPPPPTTGGNGGQIDVNAVTTPTEAEMDALRAKQASDPASLTNEDKARMQRYFDEQLQQQQNNPNPNPESLKPTSGADGRPIPQRMTRGIQERRFVAGPEDELDAWSDEPVAAAAADETAEDTIADIAADTARSIEAQRGDAEISTVLTDDQLRRRATRQLDDDDDLREEPFGAANVVEATPAGAPFSADPYFRGRSIADVDAERFGGRRTAATAGTGTYDDEPRYFGDDLYAEDPNAPVSGPLPTAEEAFANGSLVTDEPFIRFIPRRTGDHKLYVKVRWKADDLSEVRELPVTVRLREPVVRLDDNFPEMVREDEPVYVRVDGEHIPAFNKGLFTVSFDPNVLSFRDAELGEFFDSAPGASLYYAQPDKLSGRVILAIDANTEISELTGEGPLVYVRFKAKQDIPNRDLTQLAIVQDSASQYVLDRAGDNVLPLPVEHPIFATELVMPPTLGNYERANTPGQGPPVDPAAAASRGTPAAAGSAPAAGGTAIPSANTAGTQTAPDGVSNPVPGQGGRVPPPAANTGSTGTVNTDGTGGSGNVTVNQGAGGGGNLSVSDIGPQLPDDADIEDEEVDTELE